MIGHLYVPFNYKYLRVPKEGVAEIKKLCCGEVTEDEWQRQDCAGEIEAFLVSDFIRVGRVYSTVGRGRGNLLISECERQSRPRRFRSEWWHDLPAPEGAGKRANSSR